MIIIISLLLSLSASFASDTKLHVAVLDTGLDIYDPRFADVLCPTGHKDFTGEGLEDTNGHGTHIVGIITKAAPDHSKYCLVIVKFYPKSGHNWKYVDNAIFYAGMNSIVNYSSSGLTSGDEEKVAIQGSSAIFVVAAGNNDVYYKLAYPGGYGLSNVYVVGNWDCNNGRKAETSNYGEGVIWRCGTNILSTLPHGKYGMMSGTSMAVPLYTAELINSWNKGEK